MPRLLQKHSAMLFALLAIIMCLGLSMTALSALFWFTPAHGAGVAPTAGITPTASATPGITHGLRNELLKNSEPA